MTIRKPDGSAVSRVLFICALIGLVLSNAHGESERFRGKKANFIGDSITSGADSYVKEVKEVLGLELAMNYGIGGSALCHRNDMDCWKNKLFQGKKVDAAYPPVVSRWDKMDNDADLIFMLIGTNDFSSDVPMGPVDSINKTEFNGGLNIVLKGLKTKYPRKLIVVSTILRRTNGGEALLPYNDAIKNACKRHQVICYDAYSKSGLNFEQDFHQHAMKTTSDGLHPNAAGAKILGREIAKFISTIQ